MTLNSFLLIIILTSQLPIIVHLHRIRESLRRGNVILSAAPGAGKSTALLLDLLCHLPTDGKKILVLQPRRVIVRALANYLSEQVGESVGQRIGYQIRGERKVSNHTRLEFLTEAILTRRLQNDPELSDIAVVVFDEFHERSVHSDFGLALAIESQTALREDLRLLVMSATLDMQLLTSLMPDAEHLTVEGRQFPITYNYCPMLAPVKNTRNKHWQQRDRLERFAASVVVNALEAHCEDILVFMPSVRSIQNTCDLILTTLSEQVSSLAVDVLPLYGALKRIDQQRAIAPSRADRRKVVVATNIAETSLTIDGIGVVIDSGLERRLEIDLRTGIEGLVTKSISQASAYQRAGRAGRLANGHCYRLWSKEAHGHLAKQSPPEITQIDVSPLVLQALAWGTQLSDLPLLTQPTNAQLTAAKHQLTWLQAIDDKGGLSRHGTELIQNPSSLRLAHMQIKISQDYPQSCSWAHAAVGIAAYLEVEQSKPRQDIASAYKQWLDGLDKTTFSRMAQSLQRQSINADMSIFKSISLMQVASCIALTYPDWIGFHLGHGKYKLSNGKQVVMTRNDRVENAQWLCIGGLKQSDTGDIYVTGYQIIAPEVEQKLLTPEYVTLISIKWNGDSQRFQRLQQTRLGEIVVKQRPLSFSGVKHGEDQNVKQEWFKVITDKGFSWLPLPPSAVSFLYRCRLAEKLCQRQAIMPFKGFSKQSLMDGIDEWLIPHLSQAISFEDLKRLDWQQLFCNRLTWDQQQWVSQHLPNQYELPSGDKLKLDYSQVAITADESIKGPTLAARMQLLFGLQATPTLAEGKLSITFELLSPAHRLLQTTQDLASFWQSDSYQAIKKEMKGRYPKHLWPDDPANTAATKQTKRHLV